MIIRNAKVYTDEGVFKERDIIIEQQYFADQTSDPSEIDGSGCFAIPGLTDIHFHGCMGYDFCDGTVAAIRRIAEYQASIGVTTMVPATMTLPEERLEAICRTAADYRKEQQQYHGAASLCGINMEGPFLAGSKKGAQNSSYLQLPDPAMFERLNKASGGCIKMVAIAPELPGAREFIAAKKDEVIVCIAHTAADYDTAAAAMAGGATHITHLYNAMNPFSHRAPGPVGAGADHEQCMAELICDGVHIHPAAVRAAFKLFGEDRIILISDSMMATGLDDGDYQLGGQAVKVTAKKAQLADGTIAGSATNLLDCLRTAVLEMGIPLATAVKCAAVNPAKRIGIYDRCGSITSGKTANAVLLKTTDLSLAQVILKGQVIR